MKINERKSFLNAIFILLAAISTFTVFCPIEIFAQTAQPADPSSYGMTPGRLGANVAAVLGLIGVVFGGVALARPSGRFGRPGSFIALAAGLIGVALGGLVAAISGGRIGTGGGLAGAIIALVLGLIAIALGGLALARSRRTG
jgi:hypothetical protein